MTPVELHEMAMSRADEAGRLRRSGDIEGALHLSNEALQYALQSIEQADYAQPSRGVMLRSTAWLALDAAQPRLAEQLAAQGLADEEIPDWLAEELREVCENARAMMHERRTAPRGDAVITCAFNGPNIGYGTCEPELLMKFLHSLMTLMVRTLERTLGVPFRKTGRASAAVLEKFGPRASFAPGSMVVHIDITPAQLDLFDKAREAASAMLAGLHAVANDDAKELLQLIPDPDYRANFEALAKLLKPDGDSIHNTVIEFRRQNELERAATLRPPCSGGLATEQQDPSANADRFMDFVGELRAVDETLKQKRIKLTGESTHIVHVQDAVLEDIVRPLYGRNVRVTVRVEKRRRKVAYVMVGVPVEVNQ